MLTQTIREQMKEALKAKDEIRLSVLRGLLSSFTNELVAQKRKPDESLTDDEALSVIRRAAKQRKDSIEQFQAGGRADLAAKEEAELKIIESYLPSMMGREEIRTLAEAKKTELGVNDKSGAGQLMSALMKDLKGRAAGGDVKAVVDELLV